MRIRILPASGLNCGGQIETVPQADPPEAEPEIRVHGAIKDMLPGEPEGVGGTAGQGRGGAQPECNAWGISGVDYCLELVRLKARLADPS